LITDEIVPGSTISIKAAFDGGKRKDFFR